MALRSLILLTLSWRAFCAARYPHILFVVADDYGWNDVGFNQNAISAANPTGEKTTLDLIKTPTIDHLASEGCKLSNYYVQPLCSPTRGTILTGRYPSHTGIGPNVIKPTHPYALPKMEVTLAETLRGAGYRTHMVGKWHLGFCDERYTPTFRGFDSHLGYLEGAEDYFLHTRSDSGFTGLDFRASTLHSAGILPNATEAYKGTYSAHVFAERVGAIVAEHNDSQPLFVYLPFQSVHGPLQAPQAQIKKYHYIKDVARRKYAAMVTTMDEALAKVVEAFKAKGIWNDTVLIFTTDNGGPLGSANNFPLRGHKATAWEGGVHGVAFVRGTSSPLAPVPAGTATAQLMHSTDWLPTLAGLAGASVGNSQPLDGVNQWGVIAQGANTTRTSVVHNCPAAAEPLSGAYRLGDFKLLIADSSMQVQAGIPQTPPAGFSPSSTCDPPASVHGQWLFNIAKDPQECHNLAATNAHELAVVLAAFKQYHQGAVPDLSLSHGTSDPTSNPSKLPGGAWGPFGEPCKYA